jgi:hypothetical protein
MEPIELNKEYKLNLNSSLSLITLRYPFKPSSINLNIPGSLSVNNNNNYDITLTNTKNGNENFNSQSRNTGSNTINNEYVLLYNNNEFQLIKPCVNIYNIKHIQDRANITNNTSTNTTNNNNSKIISTRKLISDSLSSGKPVNKKIKSKVTTKANTKKYDTNDIIKLTENLKRDGWIVDKNDSNYISIRCRKFYDGDYIDGTIIAYLTGSNNEGVALWFFLHDDGDNEDFEEHDIIKYKEYYDNDIIDDPDDNKGRKKRYRAEDIDNYESDESS